MGETSRVRPRCREPVRANSDKQTLTLDVYIVNNNKIANIFKKVDIRSYNGPLREIYRDLYGTGRGDVILMRFLALF